MDTPYITNKELIRQSKFKMDCRNKKSIAPRYIAFGHVASTDDFSESFSLISSCNPKIDY